MLGYRSMLATLKLAELCTYTTPVSASSMPPSNLSQYQPSRRLRMTDLTHTEVTVSLGSALTTATPLWNISTYRYWVFIRSNITQAGTVECFFGPTQTSVASAGTASLHIAPALYWKSLDNDRGRYPYRHSWIEMPAQATYPWARFVFSDVANPDGYLDLGMLIPHPGYIPSLPLKVPAKPSISEEVRETVAVSGPRHLQIRPRYQVRQIVLHATGPGAKAEAEDQMLGIQEAIGVSDAFVCIEDLDATVRAMNKIVYGTMTGNNPVEVWEDGWGESTVTLDYKGLI